MFGAIFNIQTLRWLMWVLYIPSCIGLIIIVLLQKGKGTGFAGAFGMGAGSDAVFGPRARKSLPVRLTYIMATAFIVLALGLSVVEGRVARGGAPDLVEPVADESTSRLEGIGEAYDEEEDAVVDEETPAPVDGEAETITPVDAPVEDAAEALETGEVEALEPEVALEDESNEAVDESSEEGDLPAAADDADATEHP